jgi:hypothetical protein
VDVDLKAVAVELHCQILEPVRIVDRFSGVSMETEIRSQQRRGATLDDAIGEELHRSGTNQGSGVSGAQLSQFRKQAVRQWIVQVNRRDHPHRQRALLVRLGVGP